MVNVHRSLVDSMSITDSCSVKVCRVRHVSDNITVTDSLRRTFSGIRNTKNYFAIISLIMLIVFDSLIVLLGTGAIYSCIHVFFSFLIFFSGYITIKKIRNRYTNNGKTTQSDRTQINCYGLVFFILFSAIQLYFAYSSTGLINLVISILLTLIVYIPTHYAFITLHFIDSS